MRQTLVTAVLCVAMAAAAAEPTELADIKVLADEGQTKKALRRLEKLLADQPERLDGQLLKGVLLVELGRTGAAKEAFELLVSRYPERPEARSNLAVLQAIGGDRESAIGELQQVVDLYPGYEAAASNLEALRGTAAADGSNASSPDSPPARLVLTAEPGSYSRSAPEPRPVPTPVAAAPGAEPDQEAAVSEPEPDAVDTTRRQEVEAVVPAPEPQTASPEPQAAPAPAALLPADSGLRTELETVVAAWAAAWSQQRVKEYLAFYAADFEPGGYGSRQAGESARRQRVAAPAFIEVEIDFDSMTLQESDRGEVDVTFSQSYRSDRYGDTVEKTLTLVREAGAWRIRRETSR